MLKSVPVAITICFLLGLLAIAGGAILLLRPTSSGTNQSLELQTATEAPEYLAASFSNIHTWSESANDRRISIQGRLHRCDGTEQWLPQDLDPQARPVVLYRFVNTCCPGHAVPAVLELSDPDGLLSEMDVQDQWIEAAGRFQAGDPRNPAAVALLNLETISALSAALQPAAEQLFPPSKMGAPCAGSRPDVTYPPQ